MPAYQLAAVVASVLIAGVAAFQVALALGLPLGGATLGGRARTVNGVLTGRFRAVAAASAVVLVVVAWVVLARAGVVGSGPAGGTVLRWVTWGIVGFLVLNSVGNLAAPHPVERWVMGPTTVVLAVLVAIVALQAP